MSENTNKPARVWLNSNWIREKLFDDGSSLLNMSIIRDKFIEELKKLPVDSQGFTRLVISKKRTPDDKSSHSIYLSEFVSKTQPASAPSAQTQTKKVAAKSKPAPTEEDNSDF